jgi:hypothetical protein
MSVWSSLHLRCHVLKKHRWVRRVGDGDEEFWECEACGAAFSGAPPSAESKYGVPPPVVGPYRDGR